MSVRLGFGVPGKGRPNQALQQTAGASALFRVQAHSAPAAAELGRSAAEGERMVEWLRFSLRAWDRLGHPIRPGEFLDRLSIAPGDPAVARDGPGNPLVWLLAVSQDDFDHVDTSADAGARSEVFTAAVHDGLVRAAGWLARQPAGVFEELRAAGRVTDVSVSGWVEQDQFELDLPPEFLRACGALGLTVSVCTND